MQSNDLNINTLNEVRGGLDIENIIQEPVQNLAVQNIIEEPVQNLAVENQAPVQVQEPVQNLQPQNAPQTLSPLSTGLLFGASRVAGDLITMKVCKKNPKSIQAKLLEASVMHFVSKVVLYAKARPQITESNNLITANIKSIISVNIAGICAFMANYCVNTLKENKEKLTPEQAKLLSDFIIMSTFIATDKWFFNNYMKSISENTIIKKIEESGFSKFKNVKQTSVFLFMDILANIVASVALTYALPMKNNPQKITDTTINALACSTTFATVQQTARALLQVAYNKMTCQRANANNR